MVTDVVPRIEKLATAVERMRPPSHLSLHEHGSERPADETVRSRNARDQRDAIEKCVEELRALIANLCKIAAYPPAKDDPTQVSIRDICAQFSDRLEAVAEAVAVGRNPEAVSDRSAELLGLTAQLRNGDIAWSGRAAKFEALQQRIDGLVDALSEYQRVQRAETEVHALETAQAKQLLAQAEFDLVQAHASERDAYPSCDPAH